MERELLTGEQKSCEIETYRFSQRGGVEALTRADLSAIIYKRVPKLTRAESRELVAQVLEEICLALLEDQKVKLHGFGVFRVLKKRARPGRNPKTKEHAVITARRVISFTPGPGLRIAVNTDRRPPLSDPV